MVIAALLTFATLLIAWIAAPGEPAPGRVAEPRRVKLAELPEAA